MLFGVVPLDYCMLSSMDTMLSFVDFVILGGLCCPLQTIC